MSDDIYSSSTTPTSAPTTIPRASHEIVGISSLLFVLIILITLFSGKLIAMFKIHYINESTISIVFGVLIGIIVTFFPESSTDLFSFDSEFFFFVLLPPIVFEAGFSLKRKHFFRNISSICIFAVIGTMISTLIIAFGLYLLSFMSILPLFNSGNPLECLLFGALISAVDPVGTLSILGNPALNIDPTLYSLIFGESVLNDAVSIVLYKIFNDYNDTAIVISFEKHFFMIIGQFCGIFIGSFLMGLVVALCASGILRHGLHLLIVDQTNNSSNDDISTIELQAIQSDKNKIETNAKKSRLIDDGDEQSESHDHDESMQSPMVRTNSQNIIYLNEYRHKESGILHLGESPSLEFSVIILFAYLSYNLGEVLSLSGIVSVFSCGICMSHYAWYNLTWIAQISLHHIIVAISKCCENFVYVYLGISTVLSFAPSTAKYGWNLALIIFTMILCILSRAANIFPLSALSNTKRTIKISLNMQIMIFFSGLRGAIAFALALNINTPHSDLIVTTTLSIVILTTVICGCTTKYMLDTLGLSNAQQVVHMNNNNTIANNDDDNDNKNNIVTDEDKEAHYYKLNAINDHKNNKTSTLVEDINIDEEETSTTFTYNEQAMKRDRKYSAVYRHWHNFDVQYMQYLFGGSANPYVQYSNIGIYSNRQQTTKNNSNARE